MTIAERNKKLKHFITCLKCEINGKFCDNNYPTQYDAGNMGEIIENLEAISRYIEQEPCEDVISRQSAINVLDEQIERCDKCLSSFDISVTDEYAVKVERASLVTYREILECLPSAQPEIIRCKECKHRASYWGNCKLLEEKYHQSVVVDGDSFCSLAKMREIEE